jgi:hypothetical protein
MSLRNTIVARNFVGVSSASDDIAGPVGGLSSLIGLGNGASGLVNGVDGNQVGSPGSEIDPRLGVLADNGGQTLTHALLAGSPAFDAGNDAIVASFSITTDQRGRARFADGPDSDTTATVDVGAFEAGSSLTALPDRTIAEDGATTVTFDVGDPSLITSITAVSSNTGLVPNAPANIDVTGSGTTRTLTLTPVANAFGTSTITVNVTSGSETASDALALTVTAVADTPTITNAATSEDVQTASGLVIARSAVDGAEVSHFKISAVAGGTVFLADGTTSVAPGGFVTAAQATAGLRFTPAPDSFATGHVTVQASLSASDAGVGGAAVVADIAVSPVADTPSITNANTAKNAQTQSGLVVTRNAADGAEVTHIKVTAISGGTLFLNDGVTPVAVGAFLTFAQASSGLRFTPALDSLDTGHVSVRASLSASDGGLGGSTATANIVIVSRVITSGADAPGAAMIRRFAGTSGPLSGPTGQFLAFEAGFAGGVRVADADLTGDGVADVIAGTGPGVAPRIVVFDGATGAVVRDFLVGFVGEGGVYVAAGDVDGDGSPDIIAGDGGASTLVRVFSGASGAPVWTGAVGDAAFVGGVRVAAGDVDGDGFADLVLGSGPGEASRVRVLSGATHAELQSQTPYGGFLGGVFVAAGDVNGDGFADVITGADAGGGPHVRVFDGRTGAERFGFFAGDSGFAGGVRVAAGDVTGDGKADIITALGPGGADTVRVFDGVSQASVATAAVVAPVAAGGLFVSTAVPSNRMVIDRPAANATVAPAFLLNGWAFEEGATGTGVDAIHVWAYPVAGGAAVFLGAATLNDARPDVGAVFGSRYASAGYHLDVTGLADGSYDVVAFAHNPAGMFNMRRVVRVQVVSPSSDVQLQVDAPVTGAVRPNFRIAGWALDVGGAGSGSGMEAVHVWAFPAAGGSPTFVGAATLGDARPDVAAVYGPRAANAGYHLDVTGLPVGDYVLRVYAKALTLPSFTVERAVPITVAPWAPSVQMFIDTPSAGTLASGSFVISGWALALDAPSTPGIAALHVWAYPVGGGAPSFLGAATLGGARPDVASLFGAAYTNSGFGLAVNSLPSGTWDIAIFPFAAGASGFDSARIVRVTVP